MSEAVQAEAQPPRAIRIAVLAMGGEGGGVLANWLVDLGEANGHVAQMTSVPGVAQRTGATIYYIELFPKDRIPAGQAPVLAQMPAPGDVDIVIASELMEAGRAIQRGIVTPDRTVLIASSHRVFAMTEKIAMADGRVDEAAILTACRTAARRFIAFDMMAMADATGSVISAVMFGATAGADVLPFDRQAFEDTIKRGGIGVKSSLAAFSAAFDAGSGGLIPPTVQETKPGATQGSPPQIGDFPAAARDMIEAGAAQCHDWGSGHTVRLYLERLQPFLDVERRSGSDKFHLLNEVARQLALAMTYEDTIRVADLKIRAGRFDRVKQEVGLKPGQLLEIREYLHPRVQEIAETLPASLGRFILDTPWARRIVERLFADGKILETTSIRGFLQLYLIAGRRNWRNSNLRDAAEQQSISEWLALVMKTAATDYPLALEIAETRGLVKGYGDTHARGYANFNALMALLPKLSGPGAAARLAALRKAALADETGAALQKEYENQKLIEPAA
ncbi:MAG: indolepyruvate oxidoreductase subunit beta family protein [Proteobacteria bacterium]|nr:indolepyruvate oxidoreductase subunit beta family protein [Pseudomonadota bacterium]